MRRVTERWLAVAVLAVPGPLASTAAAALPQAVRQAVRLLGNERRDDTDAPGLVLPESTDLNRVLRKVTEFFAQDPPKWDDGVRMLQDLLEGRVLEQEDPDHLNDPFYSVFSEDQRLYIPFARYCQRLVCQLPPEGLEAYRFLCDTRARRAFQKAAAELDVGRLQRLAELFFATEAGPDIVSLLADLATLKGELARAVHLRNWLLAGYPDLDPDRARSMLVRQAHAYSVLGDATARAEVMDVLRATSAVASVEVDGKKVAITDLEGHPAFRLRGFDGSVAAARTEPGRGFSSLELKALWWYAFRNRDPYVLKPNKSTRRQQVFFGGQRSWEMPHRGSHRPGITVLPLALDNDPLIAVKDHDRLVLLDTVSGKVHAKSADSDYFKPPANSNVLQRVPVTDFGVQRVHVADGRLYVTADNKPPVTGNSTQFPYQNRIAAFDARTNEELWRSETGGKDRRLFFQAPPIAYRGYLYAPARRKRSFCIAQLDAATGRVVNTVTVHSGGTGMLRVPAVPPVRAGNMLIHLTNAGAVAAFSLPHLELQWLRAYETRTPHQPPPPRARVTRARGFSYGIQEKRLKKWKPVAPIVFQGRVILAPTNSDSLLCLDVHTGRPVWILPRQERKRGATFDEVIGHDGERLFLGGDRLQCVDMASGKRIFEVSLDHLPNGKPEGYGTVAGGHVYLPYKGGVYRFRTEDGQADGVIPFPAPADGEPNWGVPVRLQFAGSVLMAVTEAGVAAYSVPADLVAEADGALERARRLAATGDPAAALDQLGRVLESGRAGEQAAGAARFLVRLAGEIARARKKDNGTPAALETLDWAQRVLEKAGMEFDPRLLLFRIESLDPKADAREIRALRERLADLTLLGPGARTVPDGKER